MSQKVVYRELSGFAEFEECYSLQKQVFNLSDKDILPPVFINLLTRKKPRTGFAIGAFAKEDDKERLIGFILSVAGTENSSVYGIITGIIPEYRKNGVGIGLFQMIKEKALQHKINFFYGIYEPLEGNLANLYFHKFGMRGIKYERDAYELAENSFPVDKILLKWDFESQVSKQKIAKTFVKQDLDELLNQLPIVTSKDQKVPDKILVQIPDDFVSLKQNNTSQALEWRMNSREVFTEYINNRKFQITDFYSRKINNKRENYYLLEKLNAN